MKQEPVAWMQTFVNQDGDEKNFSLSWERIGVNDIPLYTAPRELSDDLIEAIALNYVGDDDELDIIGFARAIISRSSA